jgi:hypothetical protein
MANPFWDEGREPSWSKISNYNKGQEKSLKNVTNQQNQLANGGGYQNAMGILEQYLNPQSDIYRNFEQPYLNEFNQKTLPGIANQYAGQNSMGSGLMTSGFGQALGAAGSNLQAQLAQMKQQYQRQSINDLLNQYNQLTNTSLSARPFENVYDPGTEGQLSFLGQLGDTALTAGATALGGPAGAAAYKGLTNFFSGNGGGQQSQSNAFGIGSSPQGGGGYQGSFGQLPNFGGY